MRDPGRWRCGRLLSDMASFPLRPGMAVEPDLRHSLPRGFRRRRAPPFPLQGNFAEKTRQLSYCRSQISFLIAKIGEENFRQQVTDSARRYGSRRSLSILCISRRALTGRIATENSERTSPWIEGTRQRGYTSRIVSDIPASYM
jgi:hypothetical protein